MIKADEFWKYLKKSRFDFFCGVPCSIIKDALNCLKGRRDIKYIPAVREDAALGISSGAYLTGKRGAVLMQNSGLGHTVNALTSFNLIYKIPVLMFITWRGYKGKDAPEHLIMGRKTTTLLKSLGVPFKVLNEDFRKDIDWAVNCMDKKSIPVALIIKDGLIK